MKKTEQEDINKMFRQMYTLIGRIGTQLSIFFNLSSLSDEIKDEEQRVENLKQKALASTAIAIAILSFINTTWSNAFIALKIALVILGITFAILDIYYIYKTVIRKRQLKEKQKRKEENKNKIVSEYQKYIENLENWKNKEA